MGDKVRDMLGEIITEMFSDIESCTSSVDGKRSASQFRLLCGLSYNNVLLKLVELNYSEIFPHQFVEIEQVLEVSRIMAQKVLDDDCVLDDSYYENLLKRFKEMEWLNIKKEKLDFKEK